MWAELIHECEQHHVRAQALTTNLLSLALRHSIKLLACPRVVVKVNKHDLDSISIRAGFRGALFHCRVDNGSDLRRYSYQRLTRLNIMIMCRPNSWEDLTSDPRVIRGQVSRKYGIQGHPTTRYDRAVVQQQMNNRIYFRMDYWSRFVGSVINVGYLHRFAAMVAWRPL